MNTATHLIVSDGIDLSDLVAEMDHDRPAPTKVSGTMVDLATTDAEAILREIKQRYPQVTRVIGVSLSVG